MRIQLFEFTDLAWYPGFLKRPIQEYLDFVSMKFDIFAPVLPLLEQALNESGQDRVVDLGSGAGGGLLPFWKSLKEKRPDLSIVLSDKFPVSVGAEFDDDGIEYWKESVDACEVPDAIDGYRTLFTVAHHFPPAQLKSVLQNARDRRKPIAIFEPTQRKFAQIVGMLFIVPLLALVTMVRIRPRSLSRIFFTYFVPIIPVTILWDGLVSVLRSYHPRELLALAAATSGPGYDWQAGLATGTRSRITYLIGRPESD
ncbi:MAG: hypothetical protein KDK37_07785 [Leptospiraceae bacterium]|nr:hypothetical protein [Leptospiraceae bacterium]MCB1304161.1 hypothetical protein [Leptospiraceae bacterium]